MQILENMTKAPGINGVHDLGGVELDTNDIKYIPDTPKSLWEKQIDCLQSLASKRGYMSVE